MKALIINCSPVRTGPNMPECERIFSTIGHFYGHLEIESVAHMGLTSIE
ncbi:MAG: hypothetical protein IKW81_04410 [Pseudobutyrivibrio sp.]|nr:hypothetical protein [Pseudobutyrivibrio sp.]